MPSVVELRGAEIRVRGRRILGPLTLSFGAEERWAVLGPNGSGKTTLLRLAGALRQPSSGEVRVLGARVGAADLRGLRERIAHVGHAVGDLIPPTLPVTDVVLSGKRGATVPWLQTFDDADRARAGELLDRFGCSALAGQPLVECSQGERQRVLLARALFGRPELLLLDEPAAGLDLPGRESLIRALEDAADLEAVPSILVTHHPDEIPATTTHVALLREGRLATSGPVRTVMSDEHLSACFGMPLTVTEVSGRWAVTAAR